MSWWGKVIGGAFGFFMGGPLGALLGAALGHTIDSGVDVFGEELRGDGTERAQMAFFTALFAVLGHLAKSDGRVNQAEIKVAENIMDQMRLTTEQRRVAIRLFNEGKRVDFPLEDVVEQFAAVGGRDRSLCLMFIEILVDAALIDGPLLVGERRVLARVCVVLKFSPEELEALIHGRLRGGGASGAARKSTRDPYAVLGLTPQASDADVKKAYRRLMSQHHPDKLVSKGLPEEMMEIARRKVREVRAAYDEIKSVRGTL